VLYGQVPRLAAAPLADDHPDAVVAHVQRLAAPLYPVAEHRHRLVAEHLADALRWEIRALDHRLDRVADLDLPHEAVSSWDVSGMGRLFIYNVVESCDGDHIGAHDQ